MSGRPVQDRSVWPMAALAMAAVTILVVAFGVVTGILSATVVLDVLALWPLGALAIPAWLFARFKKSSKALGLPGLLVVTWLVAALGLHLSAWSLLPSAAGDMVGPETGSISSVDLSLDISGRIDIGSSPGSALYITGPLRTGGSTGVAEAFEQTANQDLTLVLAERDDSDWFRFGGWRLLINPAARWSLDLAADVVDADLVSVDVAALSLRAASGRVALGAPSGEVSVSVSGPIRISVPDGVAVVVVGPAVAPPGWSRLPDGWTSNTPGPGWRIEVVDSEAAVEIVTR